MTARATATTRTWVAPMSCTTWSPRRSFRSNRAAGAFRSRDASLTAAISTRPARAPTVKNCRCAVTMSVWTASRPTPRWATSRIRCSVRCLAGATRALIGTMFHELAHERLYFADDSELNEAFARVVEDEGIRRWLLHQGRAGEIAAHEAAVARQKDFAALLRDTRDRLAQLYAADVPADTMRIEKQREFGQLEFRSAAASAGAGMPDTTAGLRARSTMRTWRPSRPTRIACRACKPTLRAAGRCRRSMTRSNRPVGST